jgi:microcystin-dependent protein
MPYVPTIWIDDTTEASAENMNNIENGIVDLDANKMDKTSGPVLCPPGAVMQFAMSAAPSGWLKCNGALVSRATYSGLFASIGTTFGAGNGTTTFKLPDLRGQFIRGYDDGAGIDTGRAFGSAQTDDNKSHSHSVFGLPESYGAGGASPLLLTRLYGAWAGKTGEATWDGAAGEKSAVQNTGGTESRPKNIALLYCIKY